MLVDFLGCVWVEDAIESGLAVLDLCLCYDERDKKNLLVDRFLEEDVEATRE